MASVSRHPTAVSVRSTCNFNASSYAFFFFTSLNWNFGENVSEEVVRFQNPLETAQLTFQVYQLVTQVVSGTQKHGYVLKYEV